MLQQYTCEVFDSEGTLAIQRVDLVGAAPDVQSDAVYVTRLRDMNTLDDPSTPLYVTTDEEYQEIVDVIVNAVEGEPRLKEAITRIQAISDEYEANRVRAILFVAYDRELDREGESTPVEKDKLVVDDPYELSDAEVLARWKRDGDVVSAAVFEGYDNLKGEDYETLDANEGAQEALSRALDVLQILFHGGTPAQGS